jgi:hypothetical protein
MSLGRIEAGVFQLLVPPYDEIVTRVVGRAAEGQRCMEDIAGALDRSARNYQDTEQANTNAAHSVG